MVTKAFDGEMRSSFVVKVTVSMQTIYQHISALGQNININYGSQNEATEFAGTCNFKI